jgi:hypothetical protein
VREKNSFAKGWGKQIKGKPLLIEETPSTVINL